MVPENPILKALIYGQDGRMWIATNTIGAYFCHQVFSVLRRSCDARVAPLNLEHGCNMNVGAGLVNDPQVPRQ